MHYYRKGIKYVIITITLLFSLLFYSLTMNCFQNGIMQCCWDVSSTIWSRLKDESFFGKHTFVAQVIILLKYCQFLSFVLQGFYFGRKKNTVIMSQVYILYFLCCFMLLTFSSYTYKLSPLVPVLTILDFAKVDQRFIENCYLLFKFIFT